MRRLPVLAACAGLCALLLTTACDYPQLIPSASAAEAATPSRASALVRTTAAAPTRTPTTRHKKKRSTPARTTAPKAPVSTTSPTAPAPITTAPAITVPTTTAPTAAPSAPAGTVGAAPRPGLLWTGDAESGDLSQFQDGPWNQVGGLKPATVTSPVRDGRFAIKVGITGATTSADGICCGSRDELLPSFRDLKEGDDLYFGFSTYLAPGFVTNADWQVITQFKQNFDGSPPLSLNVEQGQFKMEGGYGYPGGSRQFIKPLGTAATGEWSDWVLHVKFSSNPSAGFVEAWRNGTMVLPRFAPAGGTLYPATGSQAGGYVKTGPYRDPSITTPSTMYLDSWRIGSTQQSVTR